jgi:hypothetical protein
MTWFDSTLPSKHAREANEELHRTFNSETVGSNPTARTTRRRSQEVKASDCKPDQRVFDSPRRLNLLNAMMLSSARNTLSGDHVD